MAKERKPWTRRERFTFEAHLCPYCGGEDLRTTDGSRIVGNRRERYVECSCGKQFVMVLKKPLNSFRTQER